MQFHAVLPISRLSLNLNSLPLPPHSSLVLSLCSFISSPLFSSSQTLLSPACSSLPLPNPRLNSHSAVVRTLSMTRRCSHCSQNGHNSRTCPARGVKLFGVRVTDGYIMKSASMGNLSHYAGSANPSSSSDPSEPPPVAQGYASDDVAQASCSSNCRERKKGIPWTEEEHRLFLVGLQKLGKGDWRGIARNYVGSRTPAQVASHAQKYFIRQSNATRRKRRSSLFDIVADMSVDPVLAPEERFLRGSANVLYPAGEPENTSVNLYLSLDQDHERSQCIPSKDPGREPEETTAGSNFAVIFPATFYPPYLPIPFPCWPRNNAREEREREVHPVLRPTPVYSKDAININELVSMSTLSLQEPAGRIEPSALSGKLLGGAARQSAFHVNPAVGNSSAIHAV